MARRRASAVGGGRSVGRSELAATGIAVAKHVLVGAPRSKHTTNVRVRPRTIRHAPGVETFGVRSYEIEPLTPYVDKMSDAVERPRRDRFNRSCVVGELVVEAGVRRDEVVGAALVLASISTAGPAVSTSRACPSCLRTMALTMQQWAPPVKRSTTASGSGAAQTFRSERPRWEAGPHSEFHALRSPRRTRHGHLVALQATHSDTSSGRRYRLLSHMRTTRRSFPLSANPRGRPCRNSHASA